jgi:hypothetical protein
MTTGTPWHAIRRIVPHSIIAGVQVIQNLQQKEMTACQCVPLCLVQLPDPIVHGLEVRMMCPKCGETRLIERVDGHRWFCAVCAHSWTVSAKDIAHEPCSAHVHRSRRDGLGRYGVNGRLVV